MVFNILGNGTNPKKNVVATTQTITTTTAASTTSTAPDTTTTVLLPTTTAQVAPTITQAAPATAQTAPATTQTAPATTNPPVPYPPKTLQDVHALAMTGDPTAIKGFSTQSEGLPVCPTLSIQATVNPNITGKVLAADMAAYLFNHHHGNCNFVLQLYHSSDQASSTSPDSGVPTAGLLTLYTPAGRGDPSASDGSILDVRLGGTLDGGPSWQVSYGGGA